MEPIKVRIVFALIMSALMVTVVTFVLGPVRQAFAPGWPAQWLQQWLLAWPVASISIFTLVPHARRMALRVVALID